MPRPLDGIRVAIVVLGDLGRSPRMLYHALASADHGATVDVVSTIETPVPVCLSERIGVTVHALPACRALTRRRFEAGAAMLRALVQAAALLWLLVLRIRRPDILMVQTPPCIPTLLVTAAAARVRRSRLVVDWHNLGWMVLALKTGRDRRLVRLVRWIELRAARFADAHLCVSQAMHDTLTREARLTGAVVFYDRPAARFAPALRELPAPAVLCGHLGGNGNGPRPLVALAPSSWTLDEDFDLLLDALGQYDARAGASPLLVLLSGDGPLRRIYEARIDRLQLRHARARAVWVPYDEYPRLLAHADVGISLHRSASGVDLPMKIADMLGSGLPVRALRFGCLREQIAGEEGVQTFSTPAELADALAAVSRDPARPGRRRPPGVTWEDEWEQTCLPLLLRSGPQEALARA